MQYNLFKLPQCVLQIIARDVISYFVVHYQVAEFFVVDSTFKFNSSRVFLQIVVEAFDWVVAQINVVTTPSTNVNKLAMINIYNPLLHMKLYTNGIAICNVIQLNVHK